MKFEKMDNGSLRCTLTQDDLEEHGIGLDDFFSNTPNAREFLENLIRIAEEEVGFKTSGNMMSIQAAIMSENEIVLTFSESQVSSAEILEHIKNMFGSSAVKEIEKEKPDVKADILKEAGKSKKEKVIEGDREGYAYLLTFSSFDSVRKFCQVLPKRSKAKSRLYYLDQTQKYFLWADLNNCTRGYVYEFVAASMEYAKGIEKDSARSNFLEEHANVILKNKALETLAKL
ncbi:MAG: adaptor protein MecA [Eubacterium sp.]|jgi:adapter protein MecA 1/2|nr:adaptor protein MecA [Eubacterium sp.]